MGDWQGMQEGSRVPLTRLQMKLAAKEAKKAARAVLLAKLKSMPLSPEEMASKKAWKELKYGPKTKDPAAREAFKVAKKERQAQLRHVRAAKKRVKAEILGLSPDNGQGKKNGGKRAAGRRGQRTASPS